jgi:predicted MFS family arabinose efflux permease
MRSAAPPSLWIALGLAIGPAVSNGIGRFAYALILPAMREDLAWSYTQAGWVNTANALGYLAGALLVLAVVRRTGARVLYDAGMVVTALSLLASGLVRDDLILLGLRLVTGVGGACAFIGGGALVTSLYAEHPDRAAASIALYYAGGGGGILLTGVALPWLFAVRGAGAWSEAWIGLGLLSAALAVPSLLSSARVPPAPAAGSRAAWRKRPLVASLAGYFLFAVGSIVYMTFIIAWMRARGASAAHVSLVWGALGAAIVLSPLWWRVALERWPGGWPLAASVGACAVGAGLPLAFSSFAAMLASAVIFGSAFFIPPAAVTALSRRALPRAAWGSAIAAYTVVFGAGQPIGPLLAGAVADHTGTLFAGLVTSVGVLVAGAAVSALQRPVAARP